MITRIKELLNRALKSEGGFTLIELIMVIVILGILAATALPKFVDLSGSAKVSAIKGIAGTMAAANSANYSGCVANNRVAAANLCVSPTAFGCNDTYFASILTGSTMPIDSTGVAYSVVDNTTGAAGAALAAGATATCKFKVQGDVSASNNQTWVIQAP